MDRKKKPLMMLQSGDYDRYPVWVTPDGDDVIPLTATDHTFYPDYFVRCVLTFADGTIHEGVACVSANPIDLVSVRVFGASWPISFVRMMRTKEHIILVEKELGKREADIFPLQIRIRVDYCGLKVNIDKTEDYPYATR